MKLIAVAAGPEAIGRTTENGNRIGDLTVGGTLELVVFGGVFPGLIGGTLYLALRPWLAPLGGRRGLVFGILLLGLMGHVVFDPTNFDFRTFGHVGLNVGLFAALFLLFGATSAAAVERLDRAAHHSRAAAAIAWLGVAPAALFIGLGLASTVALLLGMSFEGSPALGLVLVGTIAAGVVGRMIGAGRPAALAVVAVPVLAGLALTGPAVFKILAG